MVVNALKLILTKAPTINKMAQAELKGAKLFSEAAATAARSETTIIPKFVQPSSDVFIKSTGTAATEAAEGVASTVSEIAAEIKATPRIKTLLEEISSMSRYNRQDMELCLDMIDPNLAKAIRNSGDLFTADEIIQMQSLLKNYKLNDIIRYHGNIAQIEAATAGSHATSGEIKKLLSDYVNKMEQFKARDAYSMQDSLNKINKGIREFGDDFSGILYRGELSDTQITRMLETYLRQKELGRPIIFYPNKLVSTSFSKRAVTVDYHYGDKCLIIIDAPKGTKGFSVNRILEGKNKYSAQQEFLLPSNTGYEITSLTHDGERLIFNVRLV